MSLLKDMRTNALTDMGIVFESKNNGEHLIINTLGGVIDYWPSTGKYYDRGTAVNGSDHDMFIHLVRNRTKGMPVTARGLLRNVENMPGVTIEECVKYEHSDAVEYLELLGQAWELINNEGNAWPTNFRERVMKALNQKPEAHNTSTKLPWEE